MEVLLSHFIVLYDYQRDMNSEKLKVLFMTIERNMNNEKFIIYHFRRTLSQQGLEIRVSSLKIYGNSVFFSFTLSLKLLTCAINWCYLCLYYSEHFLAFS